MFKFKLNRGIVNIIIGYCLITLSSVLIIKIFAYYMPNFNTSSDIRPTLNYTFFGMLSIVFYAFWEEFSYRYLIKIPGWIGAGWFVFVPYLNIAGLAIYIFGYVPSILDVWYFNLCFLCLSFIYVRKNSRLYSIFFKPSTLKICTSIILFSVSHLFNYKLHFNNFYILLFYVLILHIPFSSLLSVIIFRYRYGFFWATVLHTFNNFLPLIFSAYLPNLL